MKRVFHPEIPGNAFASVLTEIEIRTCAGEKFQPARPTVHGDNPVKVNAKIEAIFHIKGRMQPWCLGQWKDSIDGKFFANSNTGFKSRLGLTGATVGKMVTSINADTRKSWLIGMLIVFLLRIQILVAARPMLMIHFYAISIVKATNC